MILKEIDTDIKNDQVRQSTVNKNLEPELIMPKVDQLNLNKLVTTKSRKNSFYSNSRPNSARKNSGRNSARSGRTSVASNLPSNLTQTNVTDALKDIATRKNGTQVNDLGIAGFLTLGLEGNDSQPDQAKISNTPNDCASSSRLESMKLSNKCTFINSSVLYHEFKTQVK